MSRRVDIVGKSGETYGFIRMDGDTSLRPVGVTYVIAAPAGKGWRVLDSGQTENLAGGSWQPALLALREEYPKAECLIRLNVSRSVRDAEVTDIEVSAVGDRAAAPS